jgi:diguanylate cyclase
MVSKRSKCAVNGAVQAIANPLFPKAPIRPLSAVRGKMMRTRIASKQDVVRYTLLITALTVLVPVTVVTCALLPVYASLPQVFWAGIAIAALIPLFITPPIAFSGLHIVRLLTATIDRIDDHVKFDGLTGAFNRSHFLDRVRASRADGMLLIIDADHFKAINDSHGHDAGDEALKTLASVITTVVGDFGFVGRLGGEEFGAFLPDHNLRQGAAMGTLLCRMVRERGFKIGSKTQRLTISVGGTAHSENVPIGHSLKLADELLYRAKHEGRDRYIGPAMVRGRSTARLAQVG